MFLINTESLNLENFVGKPPPYAILSHTWGPDEVTFADFQSKDEARRDAKAGFKKVRLTCDQARSEHLNYAWVDTCCIDKTSSADLTTAINSMFNWYRDAAICYAYIEDCSLPSGCDDDQSVQIFKGCRWFSRGWTLQELLAPKEVVFYGTGWIEIGHKSALDHVLEQVTKIPSAILRKEKELESISVAARMSWASSRQTTREEDFAYCLMGIFDVNMPMLYGEGSKAFIRLQEQILNQVSDDSLFTWKSSPESAIDAPYRGLLALSPREFEHCADIAVFDVEQMDAAKATTIAGQGKVSLSCTVQPCNDRTVILGLKCFRKNLSETLAIETVRIGSNHYLRSSPSELLTVATPSFRKLHNVIIEKHTLRVDDQPVEDVYRRDAVYLGDLPDGVTLENTHSEFLKNKSTAREISVMDAIGRHSAFELVIDKRTSGEDTKFVGSGEDTRLLLCFWVDPLPRRTYRYYFDIARSPGIRNAESIRRAILDAKRPSDVYRTREVAIGWVILFITATYKQVEGHQMYCLDLELKINRHAKERMLAESMDRKVSEERKAHAVAEERNAHAVAEERKAHAVAKERKRIQRRKNLRQLYVSGGIFFLVLTPGFTLSVYFAVKDSGNLILAPIPTGFITVICFIYASVKWWSVRKPSC